MELQKPNVPQIVTQTGVSLATHPPLRPCMRSLTSISRVSAAMVVLLFRAAAVSQSYTHPIRYQRGRTFSARLENSPTRRGKRGFIEMPCMPEPHHYINIRSQLRTIPKRNLLPRLFKPTTPHPNAALQLPLNQQPYVPTSSTYRL